ncbi:hypothetical protein ANCCAN_27679 [Ancylostoma caninum]|uniref:ATP-dependent DNA helicase n=1 Tax=Ancylostoma caninum TaxID=29170 RepID=A0A368F3B8_ANCCA|nr:hypothetical protein ANCCAN_27679 [Ancylostoma caninum]
MSLNDCGLRAVRDSLTSSVDRGNASVYDILDDEIQPVKASTSLTPTQQFIVVSIVCVSQTPKTVGNRLFFIDGKAGCGKTYTLNALIRALEADGMRVLTTASTGIAAILLKMAERRISRYAVECAERLLRDVASAEHDHLPFGGVVMVLGGDWTFVLSENMRLHSDDRAHGDWLISVGEGNNFCDDDWMYTSTVLDNPELLANMALLTVRNCDAEELNQIVLRKLPGAPVELIGIDTPATEEDGAAGLPCDNEYFHRLTPSGLPPYILKLKPGCIAMLLRNLDVSAQLCNGTRLVVLSIMCEGKLLYCRNLCTGNFCFITRMRLDYSDDKTGIAFCRFQFPVRLSFCITINKSQGQTFDKVGVILRTPSFAHGSTYVALSRSRTKGGLKVTRNWGASVPLAPKIRNIVYRELFR